MKHKLFVASQKLLKGARRFAFIGLPALLLALVLVPLWQLGVRAPRLPQLSPAKLVYQVATEQRIAGAPLQYTGPANCAECHSAQYATWQRGKHATVSCEACHGAARPHISDGASLSANPSREACGACHDQLDTRPPGFRQVSLAQHYSHSTCTACHPAHDPTRAASRPTPTPQGATTPVPTSEPTPQTSSTPLPQPTPSASATPSAPPRLGPPIPHPLAGDCLSCHAPEGVLPLSGQHSGRTDGECLTCHLQGGE